MLKKTLAAGAISVLSATSAVACDWGRVREDMRWCLNPSNGARGHGEMVENLKRNSSQFIGGVENGFRACQRSAGSRANFTSCKREDQDKLYRTGREVCVTCG